MTPLPHGWPNTPVRYVSAELWPLARCPRCGGEVVTTARTGHCLRAYDRDGCGTTYYQRRHVGTVSAPPPAKPE